MSLFKCVLCSRVKNINAFKIILCKEMAKKYIGRKSILKHIFLTVNLNVFIFKCVLLYGYVRKLLASH